MALDAEIRKTREISVTAVCPGPVETGFFDRAEMKHRPTPSYWVEKPETTAKRAIRAAARGRPMVSTGMAAAGFRFLSWCVPDRFIARSATSRLPER